MPSIDERRLDELLRALAHPARRTLARACLDRSRPAGELVELVGLAPASVSEHLKVLRKAGVLELDKRGRFWLYRTDPGALHDAARALAQMAGDPVQPRA